MKKILTVLILGFVFMMVGCATARTGHILRKDCKVPPSVTDCRLVYYHDYESKHHIYNKVVASNISCEQLRVLLKDRKCVEKYKITTKPDTNKNPGIRHDF